MNLLSRRTPALLAATALTLSGLALATGTPAALASVDTTPGYQLHHILVDVKVGPQGDQPCRISADIYRPDGVTARHRAPAILTTHGFGGNKADDKQAAVGRLFAQQGYVVVSYSGLGFGGSECKIHLDDPEWDGKAGKQMVDVLAGKKKFVIERTGRSKSMRYVAQESPGDPRVGMIGGSYGGQIQFAIASQDKRLDALVPIITWNDLAYSLAPNNTSLAHGVSYTTPGVAKKQWIDLFFGAGIADGVDDAQVDPARNAGCPNFADEVCAAAAQLNSAGYPDDATLALARHASVASYMSKIHAPTLLVQGEADTLFNLQEAAATFRALRSQGTPTRMVWQSWGHSQGTPAPGELDFSGDSLKDSYLGRRFLSWMNHYVRGQRKAPVGPRFAYFRDWVDYDTSPANAGTAIRKAYVERRRFSQKPTASLFASGSDLVTTATGVADTSASYANPPGGPTSYSETSGVEGGQVNNEPSDAEGTFARFTSPALTEPTALVGSPRLTLHLSAPAAEGTQAGGPGGQLILFAKVYDVAPDGSRTLSERLISPVRVTDVTKPFHVTLPGVVHRFAKGHHIELVIAASDFAYANNAATQPVTVTSTADAPTVLRLPLTSRLAF